MSNRPLSYPLESSLSSALKELRDILDKKSSTAWTEYWELLTKKLHMSISASDFQKCIRELLGRDYLYIHNRIIIGIVKSASQKQRRKMSVLRKHTNDGKQKGESNSSTDMTSTVDEIESDRQRKSDDILSFIVSCSNKCLEYNRNHLVHQELYSNLKNMYTTTSFRKEKCISRPDTQCHYALFHVHSHGLNPTTTRSVDVLLGIPCATRDSSQDVSYDYTYGYFPPSYAVEVGRKIQEDRGSPAMVADVTTNIPLLIHISLQKPFCQPSNIQEKYVTDKFSLIRSSFIDSRISNICQYMSMNPRSATRNAVHLACNVFLMRILLLISKVTGNRIRTDPKETIVIDANVIRNLLSAYPQFLGPLFNSEISKLQMYSITLPEMKKPEQVKRNI